MKKLCPGCKVLYQNADADASRQQQQFNSVISQGAKAIVLDPVDSTAAASLVKLAQSQGVKVIAYDRPIPTAPADFYVSFNNEGIGKAIADSLVDHLKALKGAPAICSDYYLMNQVQNGTITQPDPTWVTSKGYFAGING